MRALRPFVVVAVLAVLALLLVAMLVGALGLARDDAADDDSPTTTASSSTSTTSPVTSTSLFARPIDDDLAAPRVGSAPAPAPIVELDAARTTALVAVSELQPDVSGDARLCALPPGGAARCDPSVPVRTDDRGRALVVLPLDGIDACEVAGAVCVVEVRAGQRVTALVSVGGAAVVEAMLVVRPASPLQPGDTVEVEVSGVPARHHLTVAQCGEVRAGGLTCGENLSTLVVPASAPLRSTLEIRGTVAASADGGCREGETCHLVVMLGDAGVIVASRAIELRATDADAATAEYDGARLAVGLGAAALLAGVALLLARRTDWRQVGLPSTTDDAPDPF